MARLWSSGFELNSSTSSMEWTELTASAIQTGTVRSGTYAYQLSSLASGVSRRARQQLFAAVNNGPLYFRTYVNFATLPTAENRFVAISGSGTVNSVVMVYLTVDSGGAIRLYDEDGVIGSPSSALSTNTWYRIEIKYDRTPAAGSQEVRARINGTEFAAGTTQNLSSGISQLYLGGNLGLEAQTQGSWFFDDVAVNNSTGSFQASYPSSGAIIHLKPNAAGDSNGFTTQVGGTAGSTNNFTRVNEVPPDDATSYNGSTTLNAEDLFNVDNSGIGATDTVNVVSVGVRMADLVGADATAAFKVEVEKTASGTKSQSGAIIPNSTGWNSNTATAPHLYPLTTYQDPDSASWTQTTLDSMQIGYIQTATNVQAIAVSNVWALVDYTIASEVTTTSTSSSISTSSTSTSSSISTSSTSSSISTSSTSSSISTSSTSSSTSLSTSSTSSSTSVSTSLSTSSTSSSTSISTSSTSSSISTSSTSSSTSISTSSTSSSTSTSFSTSSTSSSTSFSTSSTSSSTSLSTSSTSSSISTSSTSSSTSLSTSSTSSSISTSSTSSSTSFSTSSTSTSFSSSTSSTSQSTSSSVSTSSTSQSTSSSFSTSSTSSSTSQSTSTSSTSTSQSTSTSFSTSSTSTSTTVSTTTSTSSTSSSTSSTSISTSTTTTLPPDFFQATIKRITT